MFAEPKRDSEELGFATTTAALNSPDKLAQDADGERYVIEDAPKVSATVGDVWFARVVNGDGAAESLGHACA